MFVDDARKTKKRQAKNSCSSSAMCHGSSLQSFGPEAGDWLQLVHRLRATLESEREAAEVISRELPAADSDEPGAPASAWSLLEEALLQRGSSPPSAGRPSAPVSRTGTPATSSRKSTAPLPRQNLPRQNPHVAGPQRGGAVPHKLPRSTSSRAPQQDAERPRHKSSSRKQAPPSRPPTSGSATSTSSPSAPTTGLRALLQQSSTFGGGLPGALDCPAPDIRGKETERLSGGVLNGMVEDDVFETLAYMAEDDFAAAPSMAGSALHPLRAGWTDGAKGSREQAERQEPDGKTPRRSAAVEQFMSLPMRAVNRAALRPPCDLRGKDPAMPVSPARPTSAPTSLVHHPEALAQSAQSHARPEPSTEPTHLGPRLASSTTPLGSSRGRLASGRGRPSSAYHGAQEKLQAEASSERECLRSSTDELNAADSLPLRRASSAGNTVRDIRDSLECAQVGSSKNQGSKGLRESRAAVAAGVYSSGARALLRLKRAQAKALRASKTPQQRAMAAELAARVRDNISSIQDMVWEAEEKVIVEKENEELQRRAQLQRLGLDKVDTKYDKVVIEAPVIAEPRPPPRPVTPPREVALAAAAAIKEKATLNLQNIKKDQEEELRAQEEQVKKAERRRKLLDKMVMAKVLKQLEEFRANGGVEEKERKKQEDIMEGVQIRPHLMSVRDLKAWRRRNGHSEDMQVFVLDGTYGVGVRARLLQRGWIENRDPGSMCFNLCWTLRSQDIVYEVLEPSQVVNHIQGMGLLTTKAGLSNVMQRMHWEYDVSPHSVLPRLYDATTPSELLEFQQDFQQTAAAAVVQMAAEAMQPDDDPVKGRAPMTCFCPRVLYWSVLACQEHLRRHPRVSPGLHWSSRSLSDAGDPIIHDGTEDIDPSLVLPPPKKRSPAAATPRVEPAESKPATPATKPGGVELRAEHAPGGEENGDEGAAEPISTREDVKEEEDLGWSERHLTLKEHQWDAILEHLEELNAIAWGHQTAMLHRCVPFSCSAAAACAAPGPSRPSSAVHRDEAPRSSVTASGLHLTATADEDKPSNVPSLKLLEEASNATLNAMWKRWPDSYYMNNTGNAWVVKPSEAARGEGVKVGDNLKRVTQYAMDGPHRVIQKYMESPFAVRGHKMDVRQWVLVTRADPLEVYFFDECLIRLSSAPYSLDPRGFPDTAVHVCNQTLQKTVASYNAATGFAGDKNMWSSARMKQYLEEETHWGGAAWEDEVVPRMKEVALQVLRCAAPDLTQREGGGAFELLGFDFLLDESLGVWLLEINESPCLRPSTPAKAAACSRMMDGLIRLVLQLPAFTDVAAVSNEGTHGLSSEGVDAVLGGWQLLTDPENDAEDSARGEWAAAAGKNYELTVCGQRLQRATSGSSRLKSARR
ncbi:hypothetical protein CYMTET_27583 [Cymbomonas tetramitiformis]|uniref:ATP-grasp domain-containing protein n=1 Tax=Cymbomonas tetramitiformis TaxID=36881 RepID=A0AAE0FPK1_9CHLO|nr:hypothetical protein CYMTET_27583 [Cymbomonas tetramitiformis]